MMKRIGIKILAALALVACGACSRAPQPSGSVSITFSTGEPATKAGDGVVADDGGIYISENVPDLKILLVNSSGTVQARYPGGATLSSAAATEATVQFSDIPEGEYEVYAVANTGSTLTMAGVDWTTINTKTALDALLFTALSSTTPPTVGDRMPLSATGSLTVNASKNGQIDLDLLRCVAKVEVIFKNLTGADLTVTDCDVSLAGINPTTGYVFSPDGDDAAGTARNLTFDTVSSLAFDTSTNQKLSVGSLLVFPSVAPASPGYYTCSVSFNVNSVPKSFAALPVHDSKSKNIPALSRNQYLKIEIRISNKTNISFNFEVADWTEKTENVEFS